MEIAICGGLGMEHKRFRYSSRGREVVSHNIGGSGWLCAFVARALNQNPTIFSRYGEDQIGEYIERVLIDNQVRFKGAIKGSTQSFDVLLCDGDVTSYISHGDNPTLDDLKKQICEIFDYDVCIIAFNEPEIVHYICEEERRFVKKTYMVANLSGSIMFYVKKYGLRALKGFDILTMNESELSKISSYCEYNVEESLEWLMRRNRNVFITYNDHIVYSVKHKKNSMSFKRLKYVYDTIGAGDAFATSLAISMYNDEDVSISIKKAIQVSHKMCNCSNKERIDGGAWIM